MMTSLTDKEIAMLRKFKEIADNYEGNGFRSMIWTELLTESRSDNAVFGSLIAKGVIRHEGYKVEDRCWISADRVDEIAGIVAEEDEDEEFEAFLAEEWIPIEYDPAEDFAKYGRKW